MRGDIIEASNLPENEKVYLKKDWLGWRVVEPVKNPDGSWNWFNLIIGGKKNLFVLVFLFLLSLLLFLAFKESIMNYKEVLSNPCGYCADIFKGVTNGAGS
jgi:hypothetical protein